MVPVPIPGFCYVAQWYLVLSLHVNEWDLISLSWVTWFFALCSFDQRIYDCKFHIKNNLSAFPFECYFSLSALLLSKTKKKLLKCQIQYLIYVFCYLEENAYFSLLNEIRWVRTYSQHYYRLMDTDTSFNLSCPRPANISQKVLNRLCSTCLPSSLPFNWMTSLKIWADELSLMVFFSLFITPLLL